MKITLIDYGAGNLPSVEHALRQLGAATERATTPESIAAATTLVLPGVGHFGTMMHALEAQLIASPIRDALARKIPFFGICLGLQALFEASDESPDYSGFAIFPGRVSALPSDVRLPHMGWNRIAHARGSQLLRGISQDAWFYFAHTYAALAASHGGAAPAGRVIEMRPSALRAAPRATDQHSATTATCTYGRSFIAAAEQGHVLGVQFHPEKSGDAGMEVLRNFLEAVK